jgi:DnaJ-class molecular chaperone
MPGPEDDPADQLRAGKCETCDGTGRVGRYEYDSASDEMEWAGTDPCPACNGSGFDGTGCP